MNWYDTINESVQYYIRIGTIRYTNWYDTKYEAVRYELRIGTIRYTNRYDTMYKYGQSLVIN